MGSRCDNSRASKKTDDRQMLKKYMSHVLRVIGEIIWQEFCLLFTCSEHIFPVRG